MKQSEQSSPVAAPTVQTEGDAQSASHYAWLVLVVVFLLSMAGPLNQFKVPPVMTLLIDTLDLSLGTAGYLMSMFALTGFFLALPAGFILQRLGPRTTGLVAAACLIAGAVLGALSNSSGILLFSRFVEGLGMGFLSIVAPAVIAAWFPPARQGTPMGIWAAWVPAGSLLMYLVAPALAEEGSWRSVWWFGAAFAAATFLLYALFMRQPQQARRSDPGALTLSQRSLGKSLRNPQIWLLGLVFACFTYTMLAVGAYYPAFLIEQRGFTVAAAANVLAVNNVAVLFSAPFFGWLSDRHGRRKRYFTYPFLVLMLMVPVIYQIGDELIMPVFFLLGCITSAIPAVLFSVTPEVVKDPRLVGMGMAVLSLGQNQGMVVGPAVFGLLAEHSGWTVASISLLPIFIIGFALGRLVRAR